jgi:hypothetical protein
MAQLASSTFVDRYWMFITGFFGFFGVCLFINADWCFGPKSELGLTYWASVDESSVWFARSFASVLLAYLSLPYVHKKQFGTTTAKIALLKTLIPVFGPVFFYQFYICIYELPSGYNTDAPWLGLVGVPLWVPQIIMQIPIFLGNVYAVLPAKFPGSGLLMKSKMKTAPAASASKMKGRSASVAKKAK